MKRILTIITGFTWYWVSVYAVTAQDTTPRGPDQWTARNWLGFCLQIGIFILVIFGIYKLALGGEGGGVKSETRLPESDTRNPAIGGSADKSNDNK